MKKILTAYFSASGVTKKAAEKIAQILNSDLFEIKPEIPYTQADLNWRDQNSRSSLEYKDASSRPAVSEKINNMKDYDTVLVGFPIWWYKAPNIINTFLEQYDFSGKKIILFATSGGSGFGKTAEHLKASVSDTAVIKEGAILNSRINEDKIKSWI